MLLFLANTICESSEDTEQGDLDKVQCEDKNLAKF